MVRVAAGDQIRKSDLLGKWIVLCVCRVVCTYIVASLAHTADGRPRAVTNCPDSLCVSLSLPLV